MEQLQIRGVADELAATGTTIGKLVLYGRAAIDLSRLPTAYPSLLITPQSHTEEVLTRRLHRLGGTIVDGTEVAGWPRTRTGWRCACGPWTGPNALPGVLCGRRGRRAQRGARGAGPAVSGPLGGASLMLADVRLTDPPDGRPGGQRGRRRVRVRRPVRGRLVPRLRLEPAPPGGGLRSGRAVEVREVTRRALGTDFGMHDPRFLSRFHSDERQVPSYRVGRRVPGGDAAHCHSPAGGQGMNTGIQDAANLGWKLAAAVAGWGGEALLDSYQAERHPVGAGAAQQRAAGPAGPDPAPVGSGRPQRRRTAWCSGYRRSRPRRG